ncbi:archaetidylserine decarboxylase [Sphingomonas xinjiangensis]|uniref:Phosphatidylserine decarboxylase proenzyme n=1 Tax=Sphingomonas xinjiangensis TaxID=643568 RepID=A0A840YP70_9SPHN|nr:archaetidylserine decarboxylase [Sphingomonas xinjiangensis]MBB5709871.1 phosphatidylserine decarboxylase [Sphingomonas xinjiangensis]
MSDRLKVLLQYILPKKHISTIAGRIAGAKAGRMTTRAIRWFVGTYAVDMREAADPDINSYKSFNDFFTRPLRAGARPVADADFVSPVDGAISQFGAIEEHHMLQAKGHRFTTTDLVGGDHTLAAQFRHGSFANLYLSPKDYHRLHMPCSGTLKRMIYVPGTLFSVNPVTARGVPNLFARNERVVCVFESAEHGPFVMVLVGATIVGSIATVWHGVVNPKRTGKLSEWSYAEQDITLAKGDEMGRFLLGSTIVMLFKQGAIRFNEDWAPEKPVRLGEAMGNAPLPTSRDDDPQG